MGTKGHGKKTNQARTSDRSPWAEGQLRQKIEEWLNLGKSANKISAQLSQVSGWKRREIVHVLKEIMAARKWSEARLIEVIRERLEVVRSTNKIAEELAAKSGWKKREILIRIKKLIDARKWAEAQVRQKIEEWLNLGRSTTKISAQLSQMSGWKRHEFSKILKELMEVRKWSEVRLLEVIRERLPVVKSTNKIADELAVKSGWKKREILIRIKQLVEASKWSETQLRTEMVRRLELGKSVTKISGELAELSGWKKWQISKMLKAMRDAEKAAGKRKPPIDVIKEPVIVVDPSTIIRASKPLSEFVKWQDDLLSLPTSNLYKVRKWGDPVMTKYGFDVNQVNTSNFQAVGLYNNGNNEFGAVSNFIRIPREEVWRLKAMQIEDEYVAKIKDWRSQKMNWLCKFRGTIYFLDYESDHWRTAPYIRWGTLALGGNLVQVVGTERIRAKMRDGVIRTVEMARLKGFSASDWLRPLDDLLAEGLVHRCFCAYKGNDFGDSPKGIVYSPFYSVLDRDFAGLAKPTALYIPVEWLEPKAP